MAEATFAVRMFIVSALLPSPIYLMESLSTRVMFMEYFSEIEDINSILRLSKRELVMQLSKNSIIKIISVLLILSVQMAIISVRYFIFETFDLNV
jgi:hypothetical protein